MKCQLRLRVAKVKVHIVINFVSVRSLGYGGDHDGRYESDIPEQQRNEYGQSPSAYPRQPNTYGPSRTNPSDRFAERPQSIQKSGYDLPHGYHSYQPYQPQLGYPSYADNHGYGDRHSGYGEHHSGYHGDSGNHGYDEHHVNHYDTHTRVERVVEKVPVRVPVYVNVHAKPHRQHRQHHHQHHQHNNNHNHARPKHHKKHGKRIQCKDCRPVKLVYSVFKQIKTSSLPTVGDHLDLIESSVILIGEGGIIGIGKEKRDNNCAIYGGYVGPLDGREGNGRGIYDILKEALEPSSM